MVWVLVSVRPSRHQRVVVLLRRSVALVRRSAGRVVFEPQRWVGRAPIVRDGSFCSSDKHITRAVHSIQKFVSVSLHRLNIIVFLFSLDKLSIDPFCAVS